MSLFQALILGIVEGLTEFLPISSTAHLEIASRLLGLGQAEFVKSFEIIIQFGAILAVVVIYFGLLKRDSAVWKRIIVAFIPTGVIGFVLYKLIKTVLLNDFWIIIWTLGIGGAILIAFELLVKDRPTDSSTLEIETMSYSKAFIIGVAQSLAVIPGISRSAVTIIAGRSLGLSRKAVVEFSFLLAIPTVLAASGYDFLKNASSFDMTQMSVLVVGFIASFVSALVAVRFLIRYVQNNTLGAFGVYRIVLSLAIISLVL